MKVLFPFLSGFGLAMALNAEMPNVILFVMLFGVALAGTFGLEQNNA